MSQAVIQMPADGRTSAVSTASIQEFVDPASVRRAYFLQELKTEATVAALDLLSIAVAFAVTAGGFAASGLVTCIPQPLMWFCFGFAFLALSKALGLYKAGIHPSYELGRLIVAGVTTSLLCGSHFLAAGASSWVFWLGLLPAVALLVPSFRSIGRSWLARKDWWGVNCLVYGANRRVASLYKQHRENRKQGLKPVGFLQDGVPDKCPDDLRRLYLGGADQTDSKSAQKEASCALLHRCGRTDGEIHKFIEQHLSQFARVVIVHDDPRVPSLRSMGASGYSIEDNLLKTSSKYTKRFVDLACVIAIFIFGSPVLLGLAVWVKCTSVGPVFYGHTRIGKDGKRFKAWKFRSMVMNADEVLEKCLASSPERRAEWEATYKLQDDPRITRAGRFLRKTSLDELPQLWNVLVGEMSLVGPRPIVEGEIERYKETYLSYLRVQPGITGLWQVSGRNLTTYERRVELDEFYVRNWSVWFDFYILCRTVKTVLLREGAF